MTVSKRGRQARGWLIAAMGYLVAAAAEFVADAASGWTSWRTVFVVVFLVLALITFFQWRTRRSE